MAYEVKILADSIAPTQCRLTTFELTYPRIVHSEFMTHRMFSRNSASSRAIPVEKMIQRVMEDPFIPVHWGKNQKGMQADQELTPDEQNRVTGFWLNARDAAVDRAEVLLQAGVHKQIANRLLEPWMFITVICSATDYANFFHLRCHKDAQPEIQKLAYMMRDAYESSLPVLREPPSASDPTGQGRTSAWHLPLVTDEERDEMSLNDLIRISVGRCARVSYLTHDGVRDPEADIQLHDRLMKSGHWSPFEHVSSPTKEAIHTANFRGWRQWRRSQRGENFMGVPHAQD